LTLALTANAAVAPPVGVQAADQLDLTATVRSLLEPELDPSNNTATLKLAPGGDAGRRVVLPRSSGRGGRDRHFAGTAVRSASKPVVVRLTARR
jgi:hypothetical protein